MLLQVNLEIVNLIWLIFLNLAGFDYDMLYICILKVSTV